MWCDQLYSLLTKMYMLHGWQNESFAIHFELAACELKKMTL